VLLTIDIGNTHVKIGVFDGRRLVSTWRLATDISATADEYAVWLEALLRRQELAFSDFVGCAIASVVPPLTQTLTTFGERYLGQPPLIVRYGLRLGLEVYYNPPTTLGADRLVAVVGARHRYGAPVLVVTLGTATTFNLVSPDGDFVGGAIAVGVETAAEALHQATAQLPLVDLAAPKRIIGRDSEESVRAGVLYGYVGLVEGLVQRLRATVTNGGVSPLLLGEGPGVRDVGYLLVVATGGLAGLIAPLTPVIDVVDQGLSLEGLRLVWEMNR
jgi:type III pantothenate kinase